MTADFWFCIGVIVYSIITTIKAEIYIVTVEGDPIISYRGDIEGFEATAVESDEKIDTSRYYYNGLFLLFLMHSSFLMVPSLFTF